MIKNVVSLWPLIVLGVVGLGAGSCTHAKTLVVHDTLLIARVERHECLGKCPVYTASLWSNGVVTYEGSHCVRVKGEHEKQLSAETVQFVERALSQVNYCALESEYVKVDSTDGTTVVTSSSTCGRLKTVRHYHGDTTAPLALTKLEDQLDVLLETVQWVGMEKDRDCGDPLEHEA